MPIQRSQSAPQPIEALFNVTPAKLSAAQGKGLALSRVKLLRSKSYVVDRSSSSSPLASPWVERDDPFSLGGFFSTRIALGEEQWGWLHGEKENEPGQSPFHVEERLERLEDEQAEKAIKDEDKFGLLSLGTVLTSMHWNPDDRLLSPYSEGEAIDHDSLYLSLCGRRKAINHTQNSTSDSHSNELFFPATTEEEEPEAGSYLGAIFNRIF